MFPTASGRPARLPAVAGTPVDPASRRTRPWAAVLSSPTGWPAAGRATLLATALALAACGRGPAEPAAAPAASAAAAGRMAASGAATAATAASAPVLLLAPEDWLVVGSAAAAGGPVVSGSLQPERRADLRAEVAGVVLQVLRDNGEPVRAGELLLKIDDAALRDALASSEAAQRAADQTLQQAERQLQRQKSLQGQGMTTLQALEDAELRRQSAVSEQVAARARVANARQALARTEVRAPFAGLLSERKVSAGDTVQPGRELLKVFDPATQRFEGLVAAERLSELKPGLPVRFRVAGAGGTEFNGHLRRVDASANAGTRQAAVLVSFDDPQAAPRTAGLYAEGRILTGHRSQLVLPESAVQRSGATTQAWRLVPAAGGGWQLQRVPLKLGPRDARRGDLPVLEGLAPGDRVLRHPGEALVDGQAVQLAAPPPSPSATAPSGAVGTAPARGA